MQDEAVLDYRKQNNEIKIDCFLKHIPSLIVRDSTVHIIPKNSLCNISLKP